MQIDPEDFKRHYAMLSDDALLEIDRRELVDGARIYYDAELAERQLAQPANAGRDTELSDETDHKAQAGLELVATFFSPEEANVARGLLQSADIPCSFEDDQGAVWSGIGELRLMVPTSAYDHACEMLESEITEADLIAQAEGEAADAADDES